MRFLKSLVYGYLGAILAGVVVAVVVAAAVAAVVVLAPRVVRLCVFFLCSVAMTAVRVFVGVIAVDCMVVIIGVEVKFMWS